MQFPPILAIQSVAVIVSAVLVIGFHIRKHGFVSKGHETALVSSLFMTTLVGFLIGEMVMGLYFAYTGEPYHGETMDSIRRIVSIGVVGLIIHLYIVGFTLHETLCKGAEKEASEEDSTSRQ